MSAHNSNRTSTGRQVAILAGLLALMLLATSCSVPGIERDASGGGQELRLAGSTFGITTLDPALVRDVDTAFLSRQVFRGLMRLDKSLQPVPDLAEQVEVSEDGMTYRFHLHSGLTFHNGTAIDAQAVVASFNRASDPSLAGGDGSSLPAALYFSDIVGIDARIRGEAPAISGISAVDDLTVEIQLKQPVVTFLMKMTGSPAAIVDASTATDDRWWRQPAGSGPFSVASFEQGQRLELVAFDEYTGGRPKLDAVTVLIGSAASQPLNLYESGQIDVTQVPGWALDRVMSPSDALHDHLVTVEQMSTSFIAFNPTIHPYDDERARHLVARAFDVERFVELSMADRVVLAQGLIPPGVGGREWPSEPLAYDLNIARDLAVDLSVADESLQIVEPGGGVSSVIRSVMARDLGVDLVVLDQPWPEFADRLVTRDMPAIVLTWVADYPDPENTLSAMFRTGSPDNYTAYSNPEFDRLVDEALVERDPGRRAELYLQAQQVLIDDAGAIPLYHGMSYTLVQPEVQGLEITPIGILGLEHVWIESDSS